MAGRIVKVSGPLIVAENMADVKVYDVVKVGKDELIGEVIELRRDRASIQVYEETSGLGVGDEVVSTATAVRRARARYRGRNLRRHTAPLGSNRRKLRRQNNARRKSR